MGMSIEKAIENLNEIIEEGWLISDMEKCTAIDACEVAIDIMHKYEKIKQILKDIPYGGEATVRRIQEVVEDDNT